MNGTNNSDKGRDKKSNMPGKAPGSLRDGPDTRG